MARRWIASQPVAVAVLAWLVPGAGYCLLGHRARGAIVFIAVLATLLMGILIGGIRVMDPPGWGQLGFKTQIIGVGNQLVRVETHSAAEEQQPIYHAPRGAERVRVYHVGWVLTEQPFSEIFSNKPWSIGQVFVGPVYAAGAAISVHCARPIASKPLEQGVPQSHSRSWELGTLYTAIAGMLNLLVIVDCAFRAAQEAGEDQ